MTIGLNRNIKVVFKYLRWFSVKEGEAFFITPDGRTLLGDKVIENFFNNSNSERTF